jgi:hypothetical protein
MRRMRRTSRRNDGGNLCGLIEKGEDLKCGSPGITVALNHTCKKHNRASQGIFRDMESSVVFPLKEIRLQEIDSGPLEMDSRDLGKILGCNSFRA